MLKSNSDLAVMQMEWDYSALDNEGVPAAFMQASSVFRSGVMHTAGDGVALYRLATSNNSKLTVRFMTDNDPSEKARIASTGLYYRGTDEMPFKKGILMSRNYILDFDLVSKGRLMGLELRIVLNIAKNPTVGVILGSLAHEFGVHAADYYPYLKEVLTGDVSDAQDARRKLDRDFNIGGKFSEEEQHKHLAKGTSLYYNALVATIRDSELNTYYHSWFTSNKKDFIADVSSDKRNHLAKHFPDDFQREEIKTMMPHFNEMFDYALNKGVSMSELQSQADALVKGMEKLVKKDQT